MTPSIKYIIFLLLAPLVFVCQKTVTHTVYYASNVYTLNKSQKKSIDSFLDANAFESITLTGYADTIGNIKANLKISKLRAEGIHNYIHGNIKTAKIDVNANGETHLKKTTTLHNQRRVDITLRLTSMKSLEESTQDELVVVNEKKDIINTLKKITTPKNEFIEKVATSDFVVMDKILFEPGKTMFLHNRIPDQLLYLLEVMDSLPDLQIRIHGHVCCIDDKKLSTGRAKSIYLYLKGNGVERYRMSYVGHSNSQPLFEETSVANQQKNRRVEIEFLKND